MEQSLFIEWINKYFPAITVSVVENLNGTTNPLTYLHQRMLRPDFSVTGKWESTLANYSMVMADIVAMDSSLPLKKRDAVGRASGDIPKMGMELKLNETQLTELDTLVATGGTPAQIVAKLFADVPRVIGGIYEKNEAIFLEALSTGLALIDDTENTGAGVRLDYGYPAANKFGAASVVWSNIASTPFEDMQRVITAAGLQGNTIRKIMMDRTALNNMVKTTEVKNLYAFNLGFTGATIPTPSLAQVSALGQDRLGVTFEIVDRSVQIEKNGTLTAIKPWADGRVVFLTSDNVGSLVYARLAEQNRPVSGVSYQTVNNYILVSKFSNNRPSLSEHTTSQARVVPVISGAAQIYTLDSKTVQA